MTKRYNKRKSRWFLHWPKPISSDEQQIHTECMVHIFFWKKNKSIAQMQQHRLSCLQGADRSFSISQGLRCRNTVKTTFSDFVDGNTGEPSGTDRFWSLGGELANAQRWATHPCAYSCFHLSHTKHTRAIRMSDLTPETYNSFCYCWKRFLRKIASVLQLPTWRRVQVIRIALGRATSYWITGLSFFALWKW